ncbi:MAG: hydrogenase maturation protease [Myxococcales bacterium]|nr:hydrogenase maturation protease [Myxococcales bacterium]
MTVRVIGLGQRVAGDDGVGLAVLDELERAPPPQVELCRVSDAAELVELVQTGTRVVIVDAAVGAGAPGTVRTLDAAALADSEVAPVSTHGISVGQALELAKVLAGGRLPPTSIVAIAIHPPEAYATQLSPAVRAAISVAVRVVHDLTRS